MRARIWRASRALRSMEYSEARRRQASRAVASFSGARHFSTASARARLSPTGEMSPWTPGVRISEKPFAEVVITGNPGRNPADRRIRLLTLLRPKDNFGWGQSPDEVFK